MQKLYLLHTSKVGDQLADQNHADALKKYGPLQTEERVFTLHDDVFTITFLTSGSVQDVQSAIEGEWYPNQAGFAIDEGYDTFSWATDGSEIAQKEYDRRVADGRLIES